MKQVAKKLLAVMKAVKYVQKDGKNTFQHYNYASEAALIGAIRIHLIEAGLVLVPSVTEYQIHFSEYEKNGKPITNSLTSAIVEYTVIDADSGESITFRTLGQGADTGDKGAYKAATGANKYALMKLLQIATGDDPEADTEDDDTGKKPAKAVKPTGSKRDDPETKEATIESIRTGLAYLNNNKIDGFGAAKRRLASMEKHLGIKDVQKLAECSNKQLREYYAHLQQKAKDAPRVEPEDAPPGEAA